MSTAKKSRLFIPPSGGLKEWRKGTDTDYTPTSAGTQRTAPAAPAHGHGHLLSPFETALRLSGHLARKPVLITATRRPWLTELVSRESGGFRAPQS